MKTGYIESSDFFPKEVRKEAKIGEYSEAYRRKIALLDWENELNYCESVLKIDDATDAEKDRARKRIKEAKEWINKIKNM